MPHSEIVSMHYRRLVQEWVSSLDITLTDSIKTWTQFPENVIETLNNETLTINHTQIRDNIKYYYVTYSLFTTPCMLCGSIIAMYISQIVPEFFPASQRSR